jgi:hypothetical protein
VSGRGSEFSDAVLGRTLEAVRRQRRRKRILAGGASVACGLGLAAALFWQGQKRGATPGEAPAVEVASPPEIQPGPPSPQRSTLAVFRTQDVAPSVRRIDDQALAEMLAGETHALMTTADGRRRLWVPES